MKLDRVIYIFNDLIRLSRIPFLTVGILPLILGFALAWRWGYKGQLGLYILSIITVLLIMEMTYYLGEINDLEGDKLNKNFNHFSGGSRVLIKGIIPEWVPLFLGYGCLLGAIFLIFYIYIQFQRDFTVFMLGGIGIFSGFFYSSKPLRFSYRGFGEILIAICYGWLPIASGFFIVSGFFVKEIISLCIPVALSIFNVILINEFPDEEADRIVGKRNIVVRLGKQRAGELYIGILMLTGFSLIKIMFVFDKITLWIWTITVFPLFLMINNIINVWREKYRKRDDLERLCLNTLLINLFITMILTIQQLLIKS